MNYSEFIAGFKNGTVDIFVNKRIAVSHINPDIYPMRYQIPVIILGWAALSCALLGVALIIWYKWWIGIILILISPAIYEVARLLAGELVARYAFKNEAFYNIALTEELIRIGRKKKIENK